MSSILLGVWHDWFTKNTISIVLMAHFVELNTIPSSLGTCICHNRFPTCSALSRPYSSTSSAMPTQHGVLVRIRSMTCRNRYCDTHKPDGCDL